jgi:hypothetical protein
LHALCLSCQHAQLSSFAGQHPNSQSLRGHNNITKWVLAKVEQLMEKIQAKDASQALTAYGYPTITALAQPLSTCIFIIVVIWGTATYIVKRKTALEDRNISLAVSAAPLGPHRTCSFAPPLNSLTPSFVKDCNRFVVFALHRSA